MFCKKITARIVAAAAAAWFLLGSFSYGEDGIEAAEKEKINLKIAAGEMLPPEQPNEDTVAVKKDKAIEAARNLLDSPDDYVLAGVYLTLKWNGAGYMWNLDFSKNAWGGGGANFGIDADTGDVLHFNAWQSYEPNKNYIARFTRDEARELAENYLCDKFKLSMDDFEMLKENPNYYSKRTGGVKEQVVYNFNYVRKYNGVPLNNYTMSISVDGTNGKILNYYFNKPGIDVPSLISPEKAISRTRALKIYKKLISFNLQYINCFEEKYMAPSIPKIVLAYVPSGNISMINAINGKVFNRRGCGRAV